MRNSKFSAYVTSAALFAGLVFAFPLPAGATANFPVVVSAADALDDGAGADDSLKQSPGDGTDGKENGGTGEDVILDEDAGPSAEPENGPDPDIVDDDSAVSDDIDTAQPQTFDGDDLDQQMAIIESNAFAGDIANAAGSPFVGIKRLAGEDRFQTAATIVQNNATLMAATQAFIAFGWNFPDALAAGAAAGNLGAPVLLAGRPGENQNTDRAVAVLNAMPNLKTVYVVGGPVGYTFPNAAKFANPAQAGRQVWSYIASRLTARSDGSKPVVDSTSLTSGADRYATAALVAKKFFPNATELFLATGANYADALTAAAIAGSRGAPVLLVNPSTTNSISNYLVSYLKGLPAGTLTAYPVGGTNALPDKAFKPDFNSIRPNVKWDRKSGDTRYETATALAGSFFKDAEVVYIARAFQFPDALAASPAAAVSQAPILLTADNNVPPALLEYLINHTAIKGCYVLGGEKGITPAVFNALKPLCADRSNAVNPTGVQVTPNFAAITTVGASTQLTAKVLPSNATYQNVTWSSDNPGVASVDANGKVTAANYGSATITARTMIGGIIGTATINVNGVNTITTSTGWKLAFSDNFSSQATTDSQWVTRNPGVFADKSGRECSANLKENAVVSGGVIHLKATKLTATPSSACRDVAKEKGFEAAKYGNAHIFTNKFSMNYGIAAARVKMPKQQGMHATFWLYVLTGTEEELDWESYGYGKGIIPGFLLNNATQTALRDTNCTFSSSGCPWPIPAASKDPNWWNEYHIYSFEWSSTEVVFKVDGEIVKDPKTGKQWPGKVAIPKVDFRINLSLYTSDWELALLKNPVAWHVWNGKDKPQVGSLPAEMAVDWVQAWTK